MRSHTVAIFTILTLVPIFGAHANEICADLFSKKYVKILKKTKSFNFDEHAAKEAVLKTSKEEIGFAVYLLEKQDLFILNSHTSKKYLNTGVYKQILATLIQNNNITSISGILSGVNFEIMLDIYLRTKNLQQAVEQTPFVKAAKSLSFKQLSAESKLKIQNFDNIIKQKSKEAPLSNEHIRKTLYEFVFRISVIK